MSDPAMNRGLLANCVAARARSGSQRRAPEAHFEWLQKESWKPGGLDAIAAEIIERWPDRFGTKTMLKLGTAADRVYSTEECVEARGSFRSHLFADIGERKFPLRGVAPKPKEIANVEDFVEDWSDRPSADMSRRWSDARWLRAEALRKSRKYPLTYAALDFVHYCLEEARHGERPAHSLSISGALFESVPYLPMSDATL